uniref:Uncharacterized protein n=1 Tax=Bubo bubo TaxID=30461 RepID=A0A8C0EEJ1_BUBBB
MLTGTHSCASKKPSPFPCLPACNHSLQTTAPTDVTSVPRRDVGGHCLFSQAAVSGCWHMHRHTSRELSLEQDFHRRPAHWRLPPAKPRPER